MGQALENRLGQEQPMTADLLLAPGAIESLVDSMRIPAILECVGGAWAVIPPEGTQFGDTVIRGKMRGGVFDMGSFIFESPDGVERGVAKLVDVTSDQAKLIRSRVDKALEELKK